MADENSIAILIAFFIALPILVWAWFQYDKINSLGETGSDLNKNDFADKIFAEIENERKLKKQFEENLVGLKKEILATAAYRKRDKIISDKEELITLSKEWNSLKTKEANLKEEVSKRLIDARVKKDFITERFIKENYYTPILKENPYTDAYQLKLEGNAEALRLKMERRQKIIDEETVIFKQWDTEKRQIIEEAFIKHKAILVNNLSNAVVINEYGHIEVDRRIEEWNRFLVSLGYRSNIDEDFISFDQVFYRKPKGYRNDSDPNYKVRNRLTWEIEAKYAKETLVLLNQFKSKTNETDFNPDHHPKNGHDFETWVADQLTQFGWQTKVTSGSGDQGVDIIASFSGKTVGIQCKRFKKAVGNKAVQEISAGIKHYKLDYAFVISTGGFTKSAKELATSTGVVLVSHRDLPSLSSLIS